ncbi:dihydroneopterin aldolase [Periweissella cryptocerci]|uniref:7,8-dihydroneopterin aldolase n=1 Tax=Periweissella cryptocerci TaxID=2506420 RepID=A0A4P6YRL7_9LACO|nr:dihydroneopterin aldolase [Periweissella cryptocerci]QBO35243.1 dihydroneopterin aldolase [Periweissella cryptocerci]
MGKIKLNNMQFHTYNGVLVEEKKIGQRIQIDVEIQYPIETQVHDDDLTTTISYADVYDDVANFVNEFNFNLIESVANGLLQLLLAKYPMAEAMTVRIRKVGVPIAGIFDNMEIEVSGVNQHDTK